MSISSEMVHVISEIVTVISESIFINVSFFMICKHQAVYLLKFIE